MEITAEFTKEQLEEVRLMREELGKRLVLGKILGSSPRFAAISKGLNDMLSDQFKSIQILSQVFFRIGFKHADAALRYIQLDRIELAGRTIRFFAWNEGFSSETPPLEGR